MLMNKSWWRESRRVQTTSRPCQRSRCLGSRWRGWRMRRRGWSCGRGSAATAGCPGWAPASPPADSTRARQPTPQSRITSSARSVWKYKNSHNIVCLLNENYEQIAIACVGSADVDIQIILEISEEVWYLNVYLLVWWHKGWGWEVPPLTLDFTQLQQLQLPGLAPWSPTVNHQRSRSKQNEGWNTNTKSIFT